MTDITLQEAGGFIVLVIAVLAYVAFIVGSLLVR